MYVCIYSVKVMKSANQPQLPITSSFLLRIRHLWLERRTMRGEEEESAPVWAKLIKTRPRLSDIP